MATSSCAVRPRINIRVETESNKGRNEENIQRERESSVAGEKHTSGKIKEENQLKTAQEK